MYVWVLNSSSKKHKWMKQLIYIVKHKRMEQLVYIVKPICLSFWVKLWEKKRFLAIKVATSSWRKTKELRKGSFLQNSMCSMTMSMNSQIGLWEDEKEAEMTRKSNIRLASDSPLDNKCILFCVKKTKA